jgi:hypothetical protein
MDAHQASQSQEDVTPPIHDAAEFNLGVTRRHNSHNNRKRSLNES